MITPTSPQDNEPPDPDPDVERFHEATRAMDRVVARVRGTQGVPPPRRPLTLRRRRRAAARHPSAWPRGKAESSGRAPQGAEHPPRRPRSTLGLALAAGTVSALILLAALAGEEPPRLADEPPPVAAEPAPDPPAPAPAPPPPALEVRRPAPGDLEVVAPAAEVLLVATDRCWLRIRVDGGEPTDLMLAAGARHRISALQRIEVRIGNPAGVELAVAGQPVDLADHGGRPIDLLVTLS